MVRKIRCLPDPALRQKAKRVPAFDKALQSLINDMLETCREAKGAGLAAPQIGVPLRLVVIELPEEAPIVLVNPEVVKRSGEREIQEGCLSIPGYTGLVKRSVSVTVKGKDREGKEIRIRGTGLLAQALEHELDHLNGVLYIDRITDKSKFREITDEDEDGFYDEEPKLG